MKLLLDMNLSPDLVGGFAHKGIEAVHWSSVGDPKAKDNEIMRYADSNGFVVFTHDLDFGAILAATNAGSPTVIQVRRQDVLSETLVKLTVTVLRQYETEVADGCLITIDPARSRVRMLPLREK